MHRRMEPADSQTMAAHAGRGRLLCAHAIFHHSGVPLCGRGATIAFQLYGGDFFGPVGLANLRQRSRYRGCVRNAADLRRWNLEYSRRPFRGAWPRVWIWTLAASLEVTQPPQRVNPSPRPYFQELRQLIIGPADGARQTELRHVMCEDAVDIVELGACNRLLRLHHIDIVADARLEALPGQVKILFGYPQILLRHFHLAACRGKVQIRVPDIAL